MELTSNNEGEGEMIHERGLDFMNNQPETPDEYPVKVYHRFCEFDKHHEYQIECAGKKSHEGYYWHFWLWFYLGTRLHNLIKSCEYFKLFSSSMNYLKGNVLLKEYKGQSPERTANHIADRIQKHFYGLLNKRGNNSL